METIYGAELVLLSLPEQAEGEYVGALFTLATPVGKNWHWLRAEEYPSADDMLLHALDYAKRVGMDRIRVVECKMVEEYMLTSEEQDDEDIEGELDLGSPC